MVVPLDDDMRIIIPVYDFLNFLRQTDKSFNTLKSYTSDLGIFWEFLNEIGYEYDPREY